MYVKATEGAADRLYVVEVVIEDIPGGGTIAKADFGAGITFLPEGVVVGKDANGLYHAIKSVALLAGSSATVVRVPKGHPYVVGETFADGASTITSIVEGETYDTITVDVALGTFSEGTILVGDTTVVPEAITINSVDFTGENHGAGLCVRGTVRVANMPYPPDAAIKAALPLIRFV